MASAHAQIAQAILPQLTNETLLEALELPRQRSVETFYTDLDLSLGNNSTHLFFSATFSPGRPGDVSVKRDDWEKLKALNRRTELLLACNFLLLSEAVADAEFMKEAQAMVQWKAKRESLLSSYAKLRDQLEQAREEQLERLRLTADSRSAAIKELFDVADFERSPGLAKLNAILEQFNEIDAEIKKIDLEEPRSSVTVSIDGVSIASALQKSRAWVLEMIRSFNESEPASEDLGKFLVRCAELFNVFKDLLSSRGVVDALGTVNYDSVTESRSARLSLPIRSVLGTGINLTILGEAGAGKTTSLQMYAYNHLTSDNKALVVYVPLVRLVEIQKLNAPSVDAEEPRPDTLEAYTLAFLESLRINMPRSEFVHRLEEGGVLLLDGIDEVIKSAPWILDSLKTLADRYSKLQIVTSSRMTGDYLDDLPFLGIAILPFTAIQRAAFICKWFGSDKARIHRISHHLQKSPQISEIVTNPLLATILCVLAENDIPLPATEVRLYEDRLKLLLGHFDVYKKVKRISTYTGHLHLLARKLAFRLHSQGRRDRERGPLYQWAIDILGAELSPDACKIAVDELIDPCNILVPMSEEESFGFGHLRYQEHLAAQEIASNRGIEILPLMQQEWWRAVFVLYAQMNQDIETLVKQLMFKGALRSVWETIEAMLAKLPKARRSRIRKYIRNNDQYFEGLLLRESTF
jgi:predicted NACHT family NTPase